MRVPVWMIFLGGFALLGMGAGITLVVISGQNRHALVRTDYYEDGLRLDEYKARERAFDALGLTLALRQESGALVAEGGGSGAGLASVRERLATLDLTVELRRPDDPAADRDVAMTYAADRPPLWVADAAPLRRGRWSARAVFSRDGSPVLERTFTYDAR